MDVINFFTMSLKLNANYIDEWCRSYMSSKLIKKQHFGHLISFDFKLQVSALTFLSALTLHEKTKGKTSDSETESYTEQKNPNEGVKK